MLKSQRTSFVVGLLALIVSLPSCDSTREPNYNNPIISGMNPDPSICRAGDNFYLVTSTFEYFPGIPIYHSKDLVNWKLIGHALDRPENCPLKGVASSGGNYAPVIRYNKGTFYISCTNYGGEGSQGAFYVSATNPAGPWSDPVWVGNWNVDPSMMFANDSMYWISPDNQGSFMVGTMDPETESFIKPLTIVAAGLGGSSPEGPHMYKINEYYYLMSAEGGTGYEHREVIQRSKSPYGPFEASPYNPVASNRNAPENPFQAIGHADMIQIQDGSWWLVCLGIRPDNGHHHLGRETFLAPVEWTDDGWPKLRYEGNVKESYKRPNLPAHLWSEEPERDNFNSETLNLNWNFLRNPYPANWSLSEQPGYLQLRGSDIAMGDKDSPAFVARRQTAFDIKASTLLNFVPTAKNDEAGLLIRGNDDNYYKFTISLIGEQKIISLQTVLKGKVAQTITQPVGNGEIILSISASRQEYSFSFSESRSDEIVLGSALTKYLSTETINGFTGVYIGMYASGNGKANANPAYFDWFDYIIK